MHAPADQRRIGGRKQDMLVPKYCGITLMVFPYFVHNIYWMVGIGTGLLALPYFLRD